MANANVRYKKLVRPHPVYQSLGNSAMQRQQTYHDLFRTSLDAKELTAVREALNKELMLGREGFKDKLERVFRRQIWPRKLSRPPVSGKSIGTGSE